jgi:hypothetical protein
VGGALHPRTAGRRDAATLLKALREAFKAHGVTLPTDATLRAAFGVARRKLARSGAKASPSRR